MSEAALWFIAAAAMGRVYQEIPGDKTKGPLWLLSACIAHIIGVILLLKAIFS